MATKYWNNGAGDGSISNASNWSPSGAPSAGDVLIFAEGPLGSGSSDVVGGDYTSLGTLSEIRIGAGFTRSFGSSSSFVKIIADDVVSDSGGVVYLDVDCNTATSKVVVAGGASGVAFFYLRGDVQELRVTGGNGNMYVQATTGFSPGSGYTEVDAIVVSSAPDVFVNLGENVSSNDTMSMDSGTISSSCVIGTLDMYGGEFTQYATAALTAVNVYGASTFNHKGTGTITTLTVSNGSAVFRDNQSDGVTVTNATINGGTIDLSSSLQNITFTNNIISNGGAVLPPLGGTVAISY